jgi:hypothetical protein
LADTRWEGGGSVESRMLGRRCWPKKRRKGRAVVDPGLEKEKRMIRSWCCPSVERNRR